MKKVLFVCTGNTCRSVMAEGIFNKMAGGRFAKSAGIAANPSYNIFGVLAAIMDEKKISYDEHVSTQVSRALMDDADIVLAMEKVHEAFLKSNFPEFAEKVFLMTEFAGETGEIPDPIGRPEDAYRRTFGRIEKLVSKVLKKAGE